MYKEPGMAKVNLLGSMINNTTKHVLVFYKAFICQDNVYIKTQHHFYRLV